MKYISNILKKFGYVKLNELTELEFINLASTKLKPSHNQYNKEDERKLFDNLVKVDGFTDYLRYTLANDKDRYFTVQTPVEQLITKGAYSRTIYFLGLASNKNKEAHNRVDSAKTNIGIKRYAR